MKKWLASSFLLLLFCCIGLLFWYNEWKYSLPTPVPGRYVAVNLNQKIKLPGKLTATNKLPLFLHFFNPDCPCSKFNIPHFKSLVNEYKDKVSFAVVVMTKNESYTEVSIRQKFSLDIPVLFDTSLATLCGVYSTPQAVLMGNDQALYYRGNYNRDRYCTDKKSNYAQMAIDALLAENKHPFFSRFALTAYGCALPLCEK